MKTTAHKTLSAICQLLCLIYIITSIIIITLGYTNKIFPEAESEVMKHSMITYYGFGIYTIAVNILIALLGGCVSSSGSKYLMGVFNKISFVMLLISICLTVYFNMFYKDIFVRKMAENQTSFNFLKILISNHYEVKNNIKVSLVINEHCTNIIKQFTANQVGFCVIVVIVSLIFKEMRNIRLYIKDEKIPKIKEVTRKGLNTNALSQRRVIDVVI